MMPCGVAWKIFATACIHKKLQYIRSISRRNFVRPQKLVVVVRKKVFISFLTELNIFCRLGYRYDAPTELGKGNIIDQLRQELYPGNDQYPGSVIIYEHERQRRDRRIACRIMPYHCKLSQERYEKPLSTVGTK